MLENTAHLLFVKLDFEVGGLEELHVGKSVAWVVDQLLLHTFQLSFLLIQDGHLVEIGLPLRLVEASDLTEAIRDVLNHLVELFYLQQDKRSTRADTFDGVGVWADSGDVFESQKVARAHHHDFLCDDLLPSLLD